MAVKNQANIELTGWLNNVADFNWGRAFKVAMDVRRQNDAGQWETVDKIIYDVTTEDKSGSWDNVKQVSVKGRITGTNNFTRKDGSAGFSIKVKAESISAAGEEKVNEAAVMQTWPTAQIGQAQNVEESAPF